MHRRSDATTAEGVSEFYSFFGDWHTLVSSPFERLQACAASVRKHILGLKNVDVCVGERYIGRW